MKTIIKTALTTGAAVGFAAASPLASAQPYGPWQPPVSAESLSGSSAMLNTPAVEGCPILDPYSNDLVFASNRPGGVGGVGGLDIWRAAWNGSGWDTPMNEATPINSDTNDYCPTPVRGKRLFFVSRRDDPNGDIYVSKLGPKGYGAPERLPAPINSDAQEWSPSWFEDDDGNDVLYFSSTRGGNHDIYVSKNWGVPVPVAELNTGADDARPNVSRNGREIVFDTNRDGGAPDIWTASRSSTSQEWSAPAPIAAVNSAAGESRASLSWDGSTLVFGSSRPGSEGEADIYVSTREKLRGPKSVQFPE